jgi:hypothetical protein
MEPEMRVVPAAAVEALLLLVLTLVGQELPGKATTAVSVLTTCLT